MKQKHSNYFIQVLFSDISCKTVLNIINILKYGSWSSLNAVNYIKAAVTLK